MTREQDLAERFGTPLYVYDLDEVAAATAGLLDALPEGVELFYALKANPHPDVVRATRPAPGRRCRAEISSAGELAAALDAGFTGADCLYTGPGKTMAELRLAIAAGVRLFSTDSVDDVRNVGAAARAEGAPVRCLLRVNGAPGGATTGIRMTGTPSQFGFDAETLPDLMPELRRVDGVEPAGLHFFPLSNARDEDSLIAEFRQTVETAAALGRDLGLPLDLLDIGGGFAAPYAVPGERPRYPNLRRELEAALDPHLPGWRAGRPRVACESGRHLVGTAGALVAGVTGVKSSRGRRYVILDVGINAFGGMSGLGRLLPVAVRPDGAGPATGRGSLVGPLCTPGDVLGREIELPDLAPGDTVVIPNAGAYGLTASLLAFLGRPAPVEVAVRGGRVVSVTRLEHRRADVRDAVPAGGPR
ncbi:type III PLP-dependent enzyme [Actinomadura sp. WMMA1423]|uniref:type III PLP-dependent enzyme n=1 Tax=Actinomadura sp. WMMA1423 TaxID=2591108 RepID=UPI001147455C|nr:type III PLP-dependent enzyme [Actinomadura sp. WMMA1423]